MMAEHVAADPATTIIDAEVSGSRAFPQDRSQAATSACSTPCRSCPVLRARPEFHSAARSRSRQNAAMASAARNDFDRRDRFARVSSRFLVSTSSRTERVVVMMYQVCRFALHVTRPRGHSSGATAYGRELRGRRGITRTLRFYCAEPGCHVATRSSRRRVVRVPGFEPGTYRLGGDRSIHLSYTREGEQQVVYQRRLP